MNEINKINSQFMQSIERKCKNFRVSEANG